jgi:transposase-like protein
MSDPETPGTAVKGLPAPAKAEAFLATLAKTGNVTLSAEAAGVGRETVYRWRRDSEDFAGAWDEANTLGTDALEDEAVTRAVAGKSDTLLIFMLKARRPEKFKERSATEHTGLGGGPIQLQPVPPDLSKVDSHELARLYREKIAPAGSDEP